VRAELMQEAQLKWAQTLEKAAKSIHSLYQQHSGLRQLPVTTVHGEVPTAEFLAATPSVDFWGINAYRGSDLAAFSGIAGTTNIFDEWQALSTKPMYLAGVGADSFNTTQMQAEVKGMQTAIGQVDEQMQADANVKIWRQADAYRSICSGVTFTTLKDDWQRAGNPQVQDAGGFVRSGAPADNFVNEEYRGLFNADHTPKLVVAALAKTWGVPTTDTDRVQIIKLGTEFKAATVALQAAQTQLNALEAERTALENQSRGVDAKIPPVMKAIEELEVKEAEAKAVLGQAQVNHNASLAAIQDWQTKSLTALQSAYQQHNQGVLDGTRYYESEVGKGLGLNKETAGLGILALLSSLLMAFGWRNKKHTLKVVGVIGLTLVIGAGAVFNTGYGLTDAHESASVFAAKHLGIGDYQTMSLGQYQIEKPVIEAYQTQTPAAKNIAWDDVAFDVHHARAASDLHFAKAAQHWQGINNTLGISADHMSEEQVAVLMASLHHVAPQVPESSLIKWHLDNIGRAKGLNPQLQTPAQLEQTLFGLGRAYGMDEAKARQAAQAALNGGNLNMTGFFGSEIGKLAFAEIGASHIYPTINDVVSRDPHKFLSAFNRGAAVAQRMQAQGEKFAGHLLPVTLQSLEAKAAETKAQLDKATQQMEQVTAQLTGARNELAALKAEKVRLLQAIEEKTKAVIAAHQKYIDAQLQKRYFEQEMNLTNTLEAAGVPDRTNWAGDEAALKNLRARIEQLKAEAVRLTKQAETSSVAAEKLDDTQTQIAQLELRAQGLQESYSARKAQAELDEALARLIDARNKLKDEISRLASMQATPEQAIDPAKTLAAISRLQQDIDKARQDLAALNTKIQQVLKDPKVMQKDELLSVYLSLETQAHNALANFGQIGPMNLGLKFGGKA
ncbi:MAG: hypothetical protein WC551_14530, partial [Patescibacteria group bacterium]